MCVVIDGYYSLSRVSSASERLVVRVKELLPEFLLNLSFNLIVGVEFRVTRKVVRKYRISNSTEVFSCVPKKKTKS